MTARGFLFGFSILAFASGALAQKLDNMIVDLKSASPAGPASWEAALGEIKDSFGDMKSGGMANFGSTYVGAAEWQKAVDKVFGTHQVSGDAEKFLAANPDRVKKDFLIIEESSAGLFQDPKKLAGFETIIQQLKQTNSPLAALPDKEIIKQFLTAKAVAGVDPTKTIQCFFWIWCDDPPPLPDPPPPPP